MDDFIIKVLPLIINGHYSDWFFKVIVGQFLSFVLNNFALLSIIAITLQKLTKITKSTWDDKLANKFVNFLSKFKPLKGEVK